MDKISHEAQGNGGRKCHVKWREVEWYTEDDMQMGTAVRQIAKLTVPSPQAHQSSQLGCVEKSGILTETHCLVWPQTTKIESRCERMNVVHGPQR